MAKTGLSDIDSQVLAFLCKEGFLNRYEITEKGREALAALLLCFPRFHEGRWGKAFIPLMSRCVPACVELAVIRDGKVLLMHRNDKFFHGYHTPGTYIGPGESYQESAQRCADKEIKCKVRVGEVIGVFSHPDSSRFHDLSVLLLCELVEGTPQMGEWFSECPADLIAVHKPYWPVIAARL